MGKSNKQWKEEYNKSLKTKEWKEKREKILKRDNNMCVECGNTHKLHVHHKEYKNDISLSYEYDDNTLVTLCETCHKNEHNIGVSVGKEIYDDLAPNFIKENNEWFYLNDGVYVAPDGSMHCDY